MLNEIITQYGNADICLLNSEVITGASTANNLNETYIRKPSLSLHTKTIVVTPLRLSSSYALLVDDKSTTKSNVTYLSYHTVNEPQEYLTYKAGRAAVTPHMSLGPSGF